MKAITEYYGKNDFTQTQFGWQAVVLSFYFIYHSNDTIELNGGALEELR